MLWIKSKPLILNSLYIYKESSRSFFIWFHIYTLYIGKRLKTRNDAQWWNSLVCIVALSSEIVCAFSRLNDVAWSLSTISSERTQLCLGTNLPKVRNQSKNRPICPYCVRKRASSIKWMKKESCFFLKKKTTTTR